MRKSGGAALPLLVVVTGLVLLLSAVPAGAGAAAGPRDALVAVIPPDAPPTYFRDPATGTPSGFAVEMMEALAAQADVKVRFVFENGWGHIIARVTRGDGDLIPSMGTSEERQKLLDFSAPMEVVTVSFFVRDSVDLVRWRPRGKTVGVIQFSVAWEQLRKDPSLHLAEYHGFEAGLFDLLAGRIDAFACPEPIFSRLVREAGVEDKIVVAGEPVTESKRSIGVRKGNHDLLKRLNRALEGFVGTQEYQRIYRKWYGKPRPFWNTQRILFFGTLAALFLGIVSAMAAWRYRSLLRINRELQEALGTIRRLHGILPICSSCKKIRDDSGAWHQLEVYIRDHSDAEFTHGLCMECANKLYPGMLRKK